MIKKLWKLFFSMVYLSTFTFGGGYVIVTLMQKKFVDEYHWINRDEMLDLVAIAQSAPGAIAVNGAIVVGYKIAGILGIIVSVIATILPPFIIISVVSLFYFLSQRGLNSHDHILIVKLCGCVARAALALEQTENPQQLTTLHADGIAHTGGLGAAHVD